MFRRHFFEFERHSRLFEKGDLKYVILDLLKDKPSHGYEIIRALEERFHGFYSPSAGSVYPTLQLLEDMGYVTSAEQDGKKVYTINEAGKGFLREREETIDKIKGHMRDWWGFDKREDFRQTYAQLWDIARLVGRRAHTMDADKLARIKEILTKAGHDIEGVINQGKG
jgi:DNA-binding PadR family transcriptional regulator